MAMHASTLLLAALTLGIVSNPAQPVVAEKPSGVNRQLMAVRGEVIRISRRERGYLLITVRPARDFSEVTVRARENDLVAPAVGRTGGSDLLGLLSEDDRENDTITAAELEEGDMVSVIYDPGPQNRAVEIYVR